MAKSGADNFSFDLIDSFEGYVSSKDKTNVSRNVLVQGSQNVYKPITGNITVRPGLKRYGEADTTVAAIKSSYEWYTSLGGVFPFRVVGATAAGSDAKLQVMSTIEDGTTPLWYDLMTGLTLTRFIFSPWYSDTEKKDRILFVKGDSNMHHWSGGLTKVAAQVAGGSTIALSDTSSTFLLQGFSNSAGELTFTINGSATVYTYTGGEATNTLTGITPALPAITAGTVILQSVLTEADSPAAGYNNDFIKTIGNQVHVGSYTSRLVYISAADDFKDYVVPSPRVAGSPELLTLDNTAKGISVRQGNAHISAGLSDWYVVSYQDITVGSTLTQQTVIDKQETSALSAALAHEFIDTVGDDIVYLSQDQQLRLYGIFRNITQAKYPSLSQAIKTELEGVDFTGGAVRAIGDRIYITSPMSGKTYFHESRETVDQAGNVIAERFWHPPQVWNISRVALINGVEYGHSNANPQIYQMWNTGQWHDDSPTDDAVPYDCNMLLSYRQHDRRQGLLEFDKVYVEGYLLQGSTVSLRIRKDYLDQNPQVNVLNDLTDPADLFPANNPEVIGGSVIGDVSIGGVLIEQGYFPKFRVISSSELGSVFEYQLEVFSATADSSWEILAIGTNATQASENAVEIMR